MNWNLDGSIKMKLDYQRLGRYVILANILVTGLVLYAAADFFPGEAAQTANSRLFAPLEPAREAEPQRKNIFQDYSVITADRFLPRPDLRPGEPMPLVPIPGLSSALDRLMKLRGTAVSSEKGLSFAIIELLPSGEFRTVKAGEEVAGATVVDIDEDSVLVSMENEEIRLSLNATEEYGTRTGKRAGSGRGLKGPGQFRRPGGREGGVAGLPQGIQEYIKSLPPDKQREAMKKWQSASPEDRKKAIKRFQEYYKAQGRSGGSRPRRDTRRRR
jgi:hypothetical protein